MSLYFLDFALYYRSPIEVLSGKWYSKESDVYSFGLTVWEIFTAYGESESGTIYDADEQLEIECTPFKEVKANEVLCSCRIHNPMS